MGLGSRSITIVKVVMKNIYIFKKYQENKCIKWCSTFVSIAPDRRAVWMVGIYKLQKLHLRSEKSCYSCNLKISTNVVYVSDSCIRLAAMN